MGISIKNEETTRLIKMLVQVSGLSITEAVQAAVEEKLSRLKTQDQLAEHILSLGRDCASRLPESIKRISHGELLYDRRGLPK